MVVKWQVGDTVIVPPMDYYGKLTAFDVECYSTNPNDYACWIVATKLALRVLLPKPYFKK